MANMLPLVKSIDQRLNAIELQLRYLEIDVEVFDQQLKPLPVAEQMQYLELSRSIENRLANIRRLLDV